MEAVGKFAYHCDRVSAGDRCGAAVTARKRCGWVMFRECDKFLNGGILPLRLKGAVMQGQQCCMEV